MVMSTLKKRKKSKEPLVQRGLVLFYMEWLRVGFTKMVTSERRLCEGEGVSHLDV